jgi:hypothetical protein
MSTKGILFSIIGAILGILALTWVAQGNEFFLLTVFGSKMENARYNAFKKSQPYRDGTIKELRKLQVDYVNSSPEHKNTIGGIILGMLGEGDEDELPADLQAFISKLRQEQLNPVKAAR